MAPGASLWKAERGGGDGWVLLRRRAAPGDDAAAPIRYLLRPSSAPPAAAVMPEIAVPPPAPAATEGCDVKEGQVVSPTQEPSFPVVRGAVVASPRSANAKQFDGTPADEQATSGDKSDDGDDTPADDGVGDDGAPDALKEAADGSSSPDDCGAPGGGSPRRRRSSLRQVRKAAARVAGRLGFILGKKGEGAPKPADDESSLPAALSGAWTTVLTAPTDDVTAGDGADDAAAAPAVGEVEVDESPPPPPPPSPAAADTNAVSASEPPQPDPDAAAASPDAESTGATGAPESETSAATSPDAESGGTAGAPATAAEVADDGGDGGDDHQLAASDEAAIDPPAELPSDGSERLPWRAHAFVLWVHDLNVCIWWCSA